MTTARRRRATSHPSAQSESDNNDGRLDNTIDTTVDNDSTVDTTTTTTTKTMNPLVKLIGGTTSAFVSVTFYIAMVVQRDGLMTAFWLGSIANAVLSKVLKKLIAQGRPPESSHNSNVIGRAAVQPSDGGMPSSHAMSLGFIGTFTILHVSVPVWLSWTTTTSAITTTQFLAQGVLLPLLIGLFTLVSLFYRVQVQLHTTEQVVVGYAIGSVNAGVFSTLCQAPLMAALSRSGVLNDQGLLPYPLLLVPALVGALIVGSVERRIGYWVEQFRK